MPAAALPDDEAERVAELHRLAVLDTPPEARFDRLTRLVATLLDVPISLMSLVDVDRQWFKSRVGMAVEQTPRDVAFSAHAILGAAPLVVPDARVDARFADNPLVSGHPGIRAYAGVPLVTRTGHRLGTLCAIDRRPRALDPSLLDVLREIADIVVEELELSAALASLRRRIAALSRRNKDLDTFGHAVSHDMQGPIRRIRSFCALIADEGDAKPEYLAHIAKAAASADTLLRDLRAYYELARAVPAQRTDARAALDLALQTLARELAQADATLTIGALPEIHLPSGLLTSLFTNLVGNAVKFRRDAPLHITIASRRCGGDWEISVADNGQGIDPRHHQRVFEMLARVSRRPGIEGSGMGLAVCRRIVDKAGGAIRLESALDAGTTVYFTVPATPR